MSKMTNYPNSMRDRRTKVFVCYANEDMSNANKLYDQLIDDGFDVWFDEINLLPGQNREIETEKAMRESDAILLCFSILSTAKEGYVHREYKRAMKIQELKPEGMIFVIPVRLDKNCDPPFFVQELRYADYPEHYDLLVTSLQTRSKNPAQEIENSQLQQSIENTIDVIDVIDEFKQAQVVLEGNFDISQQELVASLAALLHIDSNNIRILQALASQKKK